MRSVEQVVEMLSVGLPPWCSRAESGSSSPRLLEGGELLLLFVLMGDDGDDEDDDAMLMGVAGNTAAEGE